MIKHIESTLDIKLQCHAWHNPDETSPLGTVFYLSMCDQSAHTWGRYERRSRGREGCEGGGKGVEES